MRKVVLTLAIFVISTGALADNCKHLWYSEAQQISQFVENDTSKVNVNIGRLTNNELVYYTSISDDKFSTPTSYKDSVYVGCGFFEKTEVVDLYDGQYHTIRQDNEQRYLEKLKENYERINQMRNEKGIKYEK